MCLRVAKWALLFVPVWCLAAVPPASIVLDGTVCGTGVIPDRAPFRSLGSFRFELRLHNFRAPFREVQRLWQANQQIIRIEQNSTFLRWYNFANNQTIEVDTQGRTDIVLRLQRDVANGWMSAEMWNGDGAGYVARKVDLPGSAAAQAQGEVKVGCANSKDFLKADLAFFRWYSTSLPIGAPLPAAAPSAGRAASGDLADYEFEQTSSDASSNKIHLAFSHGQYTQTPSYPPIALASIEPETIIVGETAKLRGDRSMSSGTIVSYHWSQQSGPAPAVLTTVSGPEARVSARVTGEYTFLLNVTDSSGATASKKVALAVLAANVEGVVQIPDPHVAFILAPLTMHRSRANPWPWFDNTLLHFGDRWGSDFPAAPPTEDLREGAIELIKGSKALTGAGTRFTKLFSAIPATDRYIAVRNPLGNGKAGRRTLMVAKVIDDSHVTLTEPYNLDSARGVAYGVLSSEQINNYENRNYYDQAQVQYMNFYRTGQERFRQFARKIVDSRWKYASTDEGRGSPQDYAPRMVGLGGFILRALDGRPEMWPWIERYVEYHWNIWLGLRRNYDGLYYGPREGGYMLLFGAYLADGDPDPAVRKAYRAKIEDLAVNYFARLQYPDGSWRWEDPAWKGLAEQPFHVGLLLEGMISTYQLSGNPIVLASILRACDHLTAIYRPAPMRAYWYNIYDNQCPTGCGAGSDSDESIRQARALNNTLIHAYGFAWSKTGLEKYRKQGDELFASTFGHGKGPRADALSGLADSDEKQYGQSFRSSGRYLAWRLAKAPDVNAAERSKVLAVFASAPKHDEKDDRTALPAGGTRQFSALAVNTLGEPLPGVPVRWASSDTRIAEVTPAGLIRGIAQGTAHVKAVAGEAESPEWIIRVIGPVK